MNEVEQHEVTWASNDEALLRVAVSALTQQGVAASPIARVEWGGTTSYAVRLSSTNGPLSTPPKGVRVEAAPVAGVFMTGPRLPTPIEWMDRISDDRQVVLLEALDATPEGRRFSKRMLAAREIDPANPETQRGVAMILRAGVLTEEEAASLLAP